jgi:hypothetical protein
LSPNNSTLPHNAEGICDLQLVLQCTNHERCHTLLHELKAYVIYNFYRLLLEFVRQVDPEFIKHSVDRPPAKHIFPFCHATPWENGPGFFNKVRSGPIVYGARFLPWNLHSRMPLSFTPLIRFERCHACEQWHFSRCSLLLPVHTLIWVQTLKVRDFQVCSSTPPAIITEHTFSFDSHFLF